MLFSSIEFLYYFLPCVVAVYFLLPKVLRNCWLLLSSLVFYAWGEPKYVALMIASILLNYVWGLCIAKAQSQGWKRVWLTMSVITCLGLLGYYKYADFAVMNVNAIFGTGFALPKVLLPIGISFYSFQILSYTIDVYRGNVAAQRNPIDFGAYVALFPQLIAGPIVRYIDVNRELKERSTSMEDFRLGLRRFIMGLGKKILIANQLGAFVEAFRASGEKSVLFYWLYAIGFSLHIYFDFSGYSDMAIGLGRIFGFHFLENFNYPFISKSIQEFWRRWHMTLGGWFRDYLYIPLGGSRCSKAKWLRNTLFVWMFTGLWHGAAWNFVLWGLLFAGLLLIEKFVPALQKLPDWAKHTYVLILIAFSFVLFNAADMTQALGDMGGMLGLGGVPLVTDATLYYLRSYLSVFLFAIVGALPVVKQAALKVNNQVLETLAMIILLLLCTASLVDGSFNPFLYFRF
ncbi:MAG: MBOAT family protein [Oscillospiraceae bacterium]|nr:MBOAT family protein [Oscillospiraceae bacterium]